MQIQWRMLQVPAQMSKLFTSRAFCVTAKQPEVQCGVNPQYHCELFNFSTDCPSTLSNVVSYTYDAFPLPPTPSSVKNDDVIQSTIRNNM